MTSDRCKPSRVLRLAFGESSDEERDVAIAHVTSCAACGADYEAAQVIARRTVGSDPEAVAAAGPTADMIKEVRDVVMRDNEQRAVAERHAIDLVAFPAIERHRAVVDLGKHAATPALAWKLLEHADAIVFSEPQNAIPLYELAAFVADGASRSGASHSHEIRVEAWKNYAWALCVVGDYERAEEALDWADDAADQCADRRHMLAIVELSRGIMLAQMERHADALPLVASARQKFAEVGDEERRVMAVEQEASIRMRTGDAESAVRILSALVELPADDATLARRYSAIAVALEIAGVLGVASDYLTKAKAIHATLGDRGRTQLLHNAWQLGRILAKRGEIDDAIASFAEAARGFRAMESVDSAIRADMDLTEVEIDNGVATDETYERLRVAAAYATEKGLPISKCNALSYLQQLGSSATAGHIRQVRDFFAFADSHPDAQFTPAEQIS